MTDEGAKKKYAHLKGLIAGKMKTGNPVRDDLIVSDAKKNLADLIKKRPNIVFEEADSVPEKEVQEEEPEEEIEEEPTKSKGKK